MNYIEELKQVLNGFNKLAVIGVGSEIRGDDGAGIYIVNELKKRIEDPKIEFLVGGTVPENLSGLLRKMKPSHILIIDAAKMGKRSGEAALVDPKKIGERGFSTHTFSLAKIADYFQQITGAEFLFLGIEPETADFGESLSEEVRSAADKLIEELKLIFT